MKFTTTKGERFATFSADVQAFAQSIARRYIAATLADAVIVQDAALSRDVYDSRGEMQAIHDVLNVGARNGSLEHTGGNVWVSYTLHDVDGIALLVSAGYDSMEVTIAHDAAHGWEANMEARYDEDGEDNGRVVLSLDAMDDGEPSAQDAAAEKAIDAFAESEREYHARMVAAGDVNRPAPEVNEDDAAMLGASDADLRGWCNDLEARVGMDVTAFRAALEAYIAARHAEAFVTGLRAEVGAENFAAIIAANASETNADVCHSHDYADANVVMLAACGITDGAPENESDADYETRMAREGEAMTRAWDAARAMLGRPVVSP
jgi:hypothetical protein